MANLKCKIGGIESPNPFWLASAPPTDKQYNVERAFEAGWGGVVWKTLGEAGPPIVNVCSRYGSIDYNGQRMIGLNNIELITDRPLEVNLEEITAVKKAWPDRALVTRGPLALTAERVSYAVVNGNGGDDVAQLYDSPDADYFFAKPIPMRFVTFKNDDFNIQPAGIVHCAKR